MQFRASDSDASVVPTQVITRKGSEEMAGTDCCEGGGIPGG
jgi:hypothetical protein